ncbi:MAG: single-stranded-DNA-specific exonuclease RecJ [Candidatus Omnitrophota bacterium]
MKRWKIKEQDHRLQKSLSEALNISRITAQVLINRGIITVEQAKKYLSCSLDSCHDPYLLKDMRKAVKRIQRAVSKGEKILVYGDYDVDGITASALLVSALRMLGSRVESYIPNRLEEGYGLNLQAISAAQKRNVSLIITVDCGITSYREIEYANELKIDVVVTDHHRILNKKMPPACAVINPHQDDCEYPFKHLAGVSLAYKLAIALLDGGNMSAEEFLDLVSLGTVADIASQTGENRVLTKHGLSMLSRSKRAGINALKSASGLQGKDISSGHVGFILGPRINAMGRIGSPELALELLLTESECIANDLAKTLNTENKNRQKIEGKLLQEALAKAESEVDLDAHKVIVLANEGWHQGVIGIVASRFVERYHRPAILISITGNVGKGSGRSVEGFHLFDALLECKDSLLGFGGHEAACGVTIEKHMVDEFREKINEVARVSMSDGDLIPTLDVDIDIPLGDLEEKVIYELESMAPFGPDNPPPVLSSRKLIVKDDPRPIGKKGFKFFVTDKKTTCEAITFGREGHEMPKYGQTIDLAYIPSINTWRGLPSIQLEIKDIQ